MAMMMVLQDLAMKAAKMMVKAMVVPGRSLRLVSLGNESLLEHEKELLSSASVEERGLALFGTLDIVFVDCWQYLSASIKRVTICSFSLVVVGLCVWFFWPNVFRRRTGHLCFNISLGRVGLYWTLSGIFNPSSALRFVVVVSP